MVDFDSHARVKERAWILQFVKKTDPASVKFLHGYIFVKECVSFPLDMKFISDMDQCLLQGLNRQVILIHLLLMSKTIISRSL